MVNDVAEVRGTVKKYTAQMPPLNFNQRLASVNLLLLKSVIYREIPLFSGSLCCKLDA